MRETSTDPIQVKRWVSFCLNRASLVSFKYDSIFSTVFQSEHGSKTIEATLVMGSLFVVDCEAVHQESIPKEQERPEQASHLMSLIWRRVSSVSLVGSDVSIIFEPQGVLGIPGFTHVWDSAWHLGVPARQADEETVSIDCQSDGELFCSWDSEMARLLE